MHTLAEAIDRLPPREIKMWEYFSPRPPAGTTLNVRLDTPLDLYLLLLGSNAQWYACNHLPRRHSSASVHNHYVYQGQAQTQLDLHLVKNSPLGQLVYVTDKKYRIQQPITNLLNLLEADAEIISYNQARARATLAPGTLDSAYVLLAPLAPYEREGALLEISDLTELKLDANPAIFTVMQEYFAWWGADSDIYASTLLEKIEKKYGTWRELKLLALHEVCEA